MRFYKGTSRTIGGTTYRFRKGVCVGHSIHAGRTTYNFGRSGRLASVKFK